MAMKFVKGNLKLKEPNAKEDDIKEHDIYYLVPDMGGEGHDFIPKGMQGWADPELDGTPVSELLVEEVARAELESCTRRFSFGTNEGT